MLRDLHLASMGMSDLLHLQTCIEYLMYSAPMPIQSGIERNRFANLLKRINRAIAHQNWLSINGY